MPVYLRRFYYKELSDVKKEEQKQIEDVHSKNKIKPGKSINHP
tara:strand:- start:163 stop:291 length:129 start_codon:yes stop_codon:yes gene_type:complete